MIFHKERKLTVYSFMVIVFTIIAFLGYYTVYNGIYYDTFGYYSPNRLSIEPYLYCFIAYWLLLYPLKGIKFTLTPSIINILTAAKTRKLIKCWIIYYAVFLVFKLTEAIISVSVGLAATYEARHVDGETLFEYNNIIIEKFIGYGTFLLDATTPFVMVYAIGCLYLKRISFQYSILLISLCYIPSILNGIGMGSRGSLFMTAFCCLFFVILLWGYIPKNYRKSLYVIAIVFITVILIYSWVITADRVGKSDGFNSILRYFGESFPSLGFIFWDNVIYHPMGDRLFPNFFIQNESALYDSVEGSYIYWQNKTGVPVMYFKTLFGDLYIEFGVLGALLFIALLSLIISRFYRKNLLNVYNMPFLYYYYQIGVYAFAGFTKGGHVAFFQLIIIILVSFALKIFYRPTK